MRTFRFLLFFAVTLSCVAPSFGQWKQMLLPLAKPPNPFQFPYGGPYRGITYGTSNYNDGSLYYTKDGLHWLKQRVPDQLNWYWSNAYGDSVHLISAKAEPSINGTKIFYNQNQTENWEVFSIPNIRIPNLALFGNRMFGVNPNGGAMYSDDYGHTWSPCSGSPPLGQYGSFNIFESGTRLLVTNGSNKIYSSTDLGATWTYMVPSVVVTGEVLTISKAFYNRVYVIIYNAAQGTHRWCVSLDNGETWNLDPNTNIPIPSFPSFEASGKVFILNNPPNETFVSQDSGATWSPMGMGLNQIGANVLTDGKRISHDGGLTFEYGFYGWPTNHFKLSNSNQHLFYQLTNDSLLFAHDSLPNIDWQSLTLGFSPWVDAWRGDEEYLYRRVSYNPNRFAYSIDDGFTWQSLAIPDSAFVTIVLNGYFFYSKPFDANIYYTNDFGATEQVISDYGYMGYVASTGTHLYFKNQFGVIYKSMRNNPGAFIPLEQPVDTKCPACSAFAIGDYFFASTNAQELYRYDGLQWKKCKLPPGVNLVLWAFNNAADGERLFASNAYINPNFGGSRTGLFESHDGGLTWIDNSHIVGSYRNGCGFRTTKFHIYNLRSDTLNYTEVYRMDKQAKVYYRYGKIFQDANADGMYDTTEVFLSDVMLRTKNAERFTISDSTGCFRIGYDPNGDQIEPIVPNAYTHVTTPLPQVDSTSQAWSYIGIYTEPNVVDLRADIAAQTVVRPGFDATIVVTFSNVGTVASGGMVTVLLPPELSYVNATQMPNSILNDSIRFLLPILDVGQSLQISITVRCSVDASLGEVISLQTEIAPLQGTDTAPTNNSATIRVEIVGSYDPNDKAVSPEAYTPDLIVARVPLVYTVRFQNTGTYPASFVRVIDTLDARFDIRTMQVTSASHQYSLTIRNRNIIEVYFDNINLPDSTHNEPESHGFVKFSVKPDSTFTLGQIIENKAAIYFDFNQPVITNTVQTEAIAISKATTVAAQHDLRLWVTPNPGQSDFQLHLSKPIREKATLKIFNSVGELVRSETFQCFGSKYNLPSEELSSGMYFVEIATIHERYSTQFLVQK